MINFQLGTVDVSKSVSRVIVITRKNSREDYSLPKAITQKIDKLITDKENGFFTLYENDAITDAITLVSVFAKNEAKVVNDSEELRLFGAAVYKALETEKIEEVVLKGFIESFSTCERALFLEGMSLRNIALINIRRRKQRLHSKLFIWMKML